MRNTFLLLILLFASPAFTQSKSDDINYLLDNWHHAASVADNDTYFGLMTPDAHFLGTDETEDWTRDEMMEWAKEIFKRDTAWTFKKIDRNIYFYEDGKLAWFDETLDTWMGICRGSGVAVLTSEGWKIQHYVLSVAVPNDKIDAYLKL